MVQANAEVRPKSDLFKPRFAIAELERALFNISRDACVLRELIQGAGTPSVGHMVWLLNEHLDKFHEGLNPMSSIGDLEDAFTDIRYDTIVLVELAPNCGSPAIEHLIWTLRDHVQQFLEFIGLTIAEQEH